MNTTFGQNGNALLPRSCMVLGVTEKALRLKTPTGEGWIPKQAIRGDTDVSVGDTLNVRIRKYALQRIEP